MIIQDLTPTQCVDVLRQATLGRLASARDNQPYVVPVHVYFDEESLYSFATLGQKIDWMRTNPKVCVEVEEVLDRFRWATVVVFGRYEELVHTPHYEVFRQRARELFQGRNEWWQPAATAIAREDFRMPIIYRIRIEQMTGRLSIGSEAAAGAGERRRPWWLDLMFEPVRRADE